MLTVEDLTFEPIGDTDLDEAIRFLQSANPFAEHTWGWETGRFIDWRWAGNTLRDLERPGFFERHGTVVRRGSAGNAIVALVVSEYGADDHCIVTAREDASLVDSALEWLIDRREGTGLSLLPADDASWVHEVLTARGFEKGELVEASWQFDVTGLEGPTEPPEGFVIDSLAGEADFPEIQICLEGAFGGGRDRIPVLRSLAGNPLFRPELNIVARSPDGRIGAYCRGTVDPTTGVGGIDPVATHPDFQGRGLGQSIVETCFAAQARLGGREIYIGSAPEGSAGSRLYRKLGPEAMRTFSLWARPSIQGS